MAIKDIFKVSRKTFFNPSGWLGTDELKRNTIVIWDILKRTFTPTKPLRQETFQQAMKRQGITEADLPKIARKYQINAGIFVLLALGSFFFSFYYLIHHETVAGWMLCISVTALFASQAFRFHFWYFQIKNRKLGCTLREWRSGKTGE